MTASESVISLTDKLVESRHNVRFSLYPNTLPKVEGRYIARVDNEKVLGVDDVVANLVKRAGANIKGQDLIDNLTQFFTEVEFDVCDGYGVNLGVCVIYPRIGGTWEHENEAADRKKHPIAFKCRPTAEMRRLADYIDLESNGIADQNGIIQEVIDDATKSSEELSLGLTVTLYGHGLKVGADAEHKAEAGVFFRDTKNAAETRAFVSVNEPRCLKVIVPASLAKTQTYFIVVRTQLALDCQHLRKELREMTSPMHIGVVDPPADEAAPVGGNRADQSGQQG
jgi:hypothetical protein